MIVLQITTFFLAVLAVGAEKKIELEDIEQDNLRSEKEKDYDKSDNGSTGPDSSQGLVPLEFLKSGLLKYFENPAPVPQQQRYVHQYAVTEAPERSHVPQPKPQYTSSATQQAMVGYLSNVPMQIYLVPQYYTDQQSQANLHPGPPYQTSGVARVAGYQSAPEAVQTQTNFIEVPSYTAPTANTYTPQYQPPAGSVTYVSYSSQPTVAPPQPTVAPVVTYQVPVKYQTAVIAPTTATKVYYQNPRYTEINPVGDVQEQADDQKHYTTQAEISYHKPAPELPRYYNSRAPIREEYRHNAITELPHPNPILLKGSPPHLAHVPKSLPLYRPSTKPIYQSRGPITPSPYSHRPDVYGPPPPFNRRPTSLLDSYIPSSVQLEYLRRGLVKEPLAAYDAIASGRLPHPIPRHIERGFLPNQMYHTAAGGVTFGHYKRSPKIDKVPHS